jgi:polysaccharide export outer membrane protein
MIGCGGGGGAQPPLPQPMPAQASAASAANDATRPIGAEDLLEITVFDAPELSRAARVASDGAISLPVLGSVKAAGLTPTELATDIEARLRGKYMVDPHVAVDVTEARSRPIYVLGAVKKPGAYPLDGSEPVTALRALALGEGLQPTAAKGRAFVIRTLPDGQRVEIPVDVQEVVAGRAVDPPLQANDIVYVPDSPVRSLARGFADTLVRLVGRGIF